MGCDGGTIPKRHELVKTAKKEEKIDTNLSEAAKYLLCALSKAPLTCPLVICQLGKLYNKEAILEYLLNPKLYGDADKICTHIKSLKDVKPILFEHNPDFDETKNHGQSFPFLCPLNFRVLNGRYKFVYLTTCGHAFSENGLKELKQEELECPQCTLKYTEEDVKPVYPSKEEQDKILLEILENIRIKKEKKRAREAEKEGKKSKKAKDNKCSTEAEEPIVKLRTNAIKSIYASSSGAKIQQSNAPSFI